MKAQKAFTLIELLVVISIIALLSSVVLASLNAARTKAKDTRRLADMQAFRTALSIYLNDNGNSYPAAAPDRGDGWAQSYTSGSSFMANIVPTYLKGPFSDPENNAADKSYYYRLGTYGNCTASRAVIHFYLSKPAATPYIACSTQGSSAGMYGACLCLD